jgi:hypothetical protein
MLAAAKGRRSKTKTRTPAAALADISLKNDRLVPTAEAAVLLGQKPKTLREWRCDKTGPAWLKFGSGRQGRVLYRLSSLEAWVRANVTTMSGS